MNHSYYIYAWHKTHKQWYPARDVIEYLKLRFSHAWVSGIFDINVAHARLNYLEVTFPSNRFTILQGNWGTNQIAPPT